MDTIISDICVKPLGEGKYLKPFRLEFNQDGIKRDWECVKAMSSVSALLYHKQKDAFLFVKQFRPAVWYTQQQEGLISKESGFTYELCAGLLDKGISEFETIKEECIEECGYKPKNLTRITMTYGSLGFGGNTQIMFYAPIDESMRVGEGGGIKGQEKIELVFISRKKMRDFVFDESKPKGFGLLFAYFWWMDKFHKDF
ncbi:MAG: NUDIX hydrolase [Campylobacter sp.]|nr:NUDIX hydrolase [Campylobacter sp.]